MGFVGQNMEQKLKSIAQQPAVSLRYTPRWKCLASAGRLTGNENEMNGLANVLSTNPR